MSSRSSPKFEKEQRGKTSELEREEVETTLKDAIKKKANQSKRY